jgi:dTDP-4-amino-4,6-dideoxygalactose transaminase
VAGAFSFFATKHMTTGEGGMVTTNDRDIAERVRLVRSHGLIGRDDHVALGFNYRMSELAAAIGRVQLGRMPELNERRIANSLYLFERLADVPWAGLPKLYDHVKHTFFWAHVLVDENALGFSTAELVRRLRERGVEVRQRYQEPLYKQKLLLEKNPYRRGCPFQCGFYDGEVDYGRVFLPNVEKVAGRLIGLPNHPGLTQEQLDRVVDVVRHIHE